MGMDRVGTVGTGLVPTGLVGRVPTLRQGPESGSRHRFLLLLFDKCVSKSQQSFTFIMGPWVIRCFALEPFSD